MSNPGIIFLNLLLLHSDLGRYFRTHTLTMATTFSYLQFLRWAIKDLTFTDLLYA